ncbi:MAG: MFS transporter [Desulfobacterales bacterium]|nr:MFS transporter [Desulfobacterales bacterium]MBF0396032.1 MFS transporter [Desulfobacterales bacterium]
MIIKINITTDWFPSIIHAVFTGATAISAFFLTVFFSENLHFSGNQIGILFSINAITGMLAAFPAGIGNDKISSRTLIILSLFFQGLTFILLGIAKSFIWVLLIFITWSLSNWIFRLSMDVQFFKVDASKALGLRIGFYQGWRYAGFTIGAIFSGFLISKLDFKYTLMIIGVICFILIIPSMFLAKTKLAKVKISDYKAYFSNKKFILFAIWLLLFATHWGAEQTCYSLFLRKDLNLSMHGLGLYISSEFIAIIIAIVISGNLISKGFSIRRLAMYGLFTSGIGHIGMTFTPIYTSIAFRMIHGIGDGFIFVIMYYGIATLASLEHLGGNAGLISFSTMIGYVVGSLIYSPIGENFGYYFPFWISGFLTLLLIIPFIYFNFSTKKVNV